MKIKEWVIETSGMLYGPFKSSADAEEYAIKTLTYKWSIKPVWKLK